MKSPWIGADTNPYHAGWYEVKGRGFIGATERRFAKRYWDGTRWFWNDDETGEFVGAAVSKECDSWRGVVS